MSRQGPCDTPSATIRTQVHSAREVRSTKFVLPPHYGVVEMMRASRLYILPSSTAGCPERVSSSYHTLRRALAYQGNLHTCLRAPRVIISSLTSPKTRLLSAVSLTPVLPFPVFYLVLGTGKSPMITVVLLITRPSISQISTKKVLQQPLATDKTHNVSSSAPETYDGLPPLSPIFSSYNQGGISMSPAAIFLSAFSSAGSAALHPSPDDLSEEVEG